MGLLAEERHKSIIDAARQDGGVVISNIADQLGVSEMTVRRDLRQLEERGMLVRVHGGAIASGARYGQRLASNSRGKASAAGKLEAHLPKTGMIYLDGSTTMLNLVPRLRQCVGLQVVTNNCQTFIQLENISGIEPMLLGGRLDKRTDNLVGPLALRSVQAMAFDCAFFSAYGISSDLGLTEVTLEDAEVKQWVAERAQRVFIAVDSSKLGITGAGSWSPDAGKSHLATDLEAADARLSSYCRRFSEIF